MEVSIAQEVDSELERLCYAATRLDDRLRAYFSGRHYGGDVSSVFIGLILMGPGSERLHPVRPFKYKKLYKFKDLITGARTEIRNVVTLDVKPNYEALRLLNTEAAEAYIADALIAAIGVICSHQREFPLFNAAQFTGDFTTCLRQ